MDEQNQTDEVVKATTTLLWRQKMKTYFDCVDIAHTGYITKSHYEQLINFIKAKYHGLHQQAYDMVDRIFIQILWGEVATRGGDISNNRKVTLTEFTRNAAVNLKPENIEVFTKVLDYISASIYQLIDTDRDKELSVDEFSEFFILFGIPEEFSLNAFESIDKNDSGDIDKEEFMKAFRDFWVGQKPGCGTFFLGRLF
ncbi:unnamed protein product [Owenia fusiformis]|uniref:EF-hand domain-containing protein n=1 Tax=Owenia fusiformis TaxID=6347 RepID=A0A8S4Q5I3_OWEFU|nr:unnamed protein product [Owenia fusiformis]